VKGDIVCTSCGTILGQIFDYHTPPSNSESLNERRGVRGVRARILKEREKFLRSRYSKSLHRVLTYNDISLEKRSIIVDEQAFKQYIEGQRPRVKLLMHEKDPELKKFIDKNPALAIAFKLIEKIPRLSARTFRGKVAAAYTLYTIAQGIQPNPNDLSKVTGISTVHAKRIINEVIKYRKAIEYLKKTLSETNLGLRSITNINAQAKVAT